MAKVIVRTSVSATPKEVEASTIGELKQMLDLKDYTAKVNREPQTNDFVLQNDDMVKFEANVKGA